MAERMAFPLEVGRRPYNRPWSNGQSKRERVEDIEPEFGGSQYTVISLGEFDHSEDTSDLTMSC